MKFGEVWQSIVAAFKHNNPLTPKFMLWYILAIILTIMLIVASQVLPMVQSTQQLNKDIQAGKVYLQGQDSALNPNIEDFILRNDGEFDLEKLYPLRKAKDSWGLREAEGYWDDIDEKRLTELRQENRQILQKRLQNLP